MFQLYRTARRINISNYSFCESLSISVRLCKEWEEDLPKFQIPGTTLVLFNYNSGSEFWKQRAEVLGINIKWVPHVAGIPWCWRTTNLDQFSHEYNLCWWIIKHCSKNRNGGIAHFKSVFLLCLKISKFSFGKGNHLCGFCKYVCNYSLPHYFRK